MSFYFKICVHKISRQRVIGVSPENLGEKFFGARLIAQPEVCLGFEKHRRGVLPELDVVVEQKHGWLRRGEIIDLRAGFAQRLRVTRKRAQEFLHRGFLTETPKGQRGEKSRLGKSADAHLLEIAAEGNRRLPMFAGGGLVAVGGAGGTQPEIDIALVGEHMLGLAQVARRSQGEFKFDAGADEIALTQRNAAQGQMSADMLADSQSFAALPWLKMAARDDLARKFMPPRLIVKRAKFYREVIALMHKVW